jgi:4a-hydroxytetrahydrobiopterin dehydratase
MTTDVLDPWTVANKQLHRTDTFTSFSKAMDWVNAVATLATQHDHHPDIEIRYTSVRLTLWSHDVEALTDRDTQLALAINALQQAG